MKSMIRFAALFLAITLGVATPAAQAGRVVIKLGTLAPQGSVWHDALLRLREQWRDVTGGEVDLRIYPGGVLGGESEMVRKIQRGGLDAVAVAGPGLEFIDSSFNCLNLPLFLDSYEEFDFVRDGVAPELEARLEARHFKLLSWADAGWIYFFTKTPVPTPEALRQVRLWTSAGLPVTERVFREQGFRVVPLPAMEMLTGLQSGLIDAIVVPPLFALLDGTYKAAPYMTDLKWAPLNGATLISTRAWARVPEKHRSDMITAARDVARDLRLELRGAHIGALEQMQARGLEVLELSPAQRALWRAEADANYPKLRDSYVPGPFLDRVMALREQYRRANPSSSSPP